MGKRALRRQASSTADLSRLQVEALRLLDSFHEHLDEKLDEAMKNGKEKELDSGTGTFWQEAEVYFKQNQTKLLEDAAGLIALTHGWGADRSMEYIKKLISAKTVPKEPTSHLVTTVFHWIYGKKGQWRGEPNNSEVRKVARGILTSYFRNVGSSMPNDCLSCVTASPNNPIMAIPNQFCIHSIKYIVPNNFQYSSQQFGNGF